MACECSVLFLKRIVFYVTLIDTRLITDERFVNDINDLPQWLLLQQMLHDTCTCVKQDIEVKYFQIMFSCP